MTDLDDIALIYTATDKGTGAIPTAFMTRDVAMAYCSDRRSKGRTHGTEWATFWTSARNYFGRYNLQPADLDDIRDDGRLPEYPRLDAEQVRLVLDAGAAHAERERVARAVSAPTQGGLW